jgi:hypothetical protein
LFATPLDLAPFFSSQQNWIIDVLATLQVTNSATSTRVPASALTYQFLNSPTGATIDATGVITWVPAQTQGGTTNQIVTVVNDNGSPPLKATNGFFVVVRGLYSGIDLTDPAVATQDPNGDGFSNLLKYALGMDPANPMDIQNGMAVSILPASGVEFVTMTFRRRRNTPWLGYLPEVSGDRQNWFSDGAHVHQLSLFPLDDQFDSVTVQDLTPITASTPRFIRLSVVSN